MGRKKGEKRDKITGKRIMCICGLLILASVVLGSGALLQTKAMEQTKTVETQSVFSLVNTKGIYQFPMIPKAEKSEEVVEEEEVIEEVVEEVVKEEENRKLVAVTFDDGPHPLVTEAILSILEENNARGTFFILGDRVEQYKDVVQQIHDRGHQVANHTLSHKNLTKISKDKIRYEVSESEKILSQYAPSVSFYLRPPYGAINDAVKAELSVPVICWSVDSLDWKSRNSESIYNEIIGNVKDGDIILMHDLYTTTADALKLVVPELIRQGYELVTVEELLRAKGVNPKAGNVYYYAR